jgi:hypothetical protein
MLVSLIELGTNIFHPKWSVSFGQVVTRKTLSQVKPPDQKVPAGDGMVNAQSLRNGGFNMI